MKCILSSKRSYIDPKNYQKDLDKIYAVFQVMFSKSLYFNNKLVLHQFAYDCQETFHVLIYGHPKSHNHTTNPDLNRAIRIHWIDEVFNNINHCIDRNTCGLIAINRDKNIPNRINLVCPSKRFKITLEERETEFILISFFILPY